MTTESQTATTLPLPWYRQFWPWFLILLPLSVVIAGIITIIIAMRNDVHLVEEDYYNHGLSINDQLEQSRVAEELGIRARLAFTQEEGSNEHTARLFIESGELANSIPKLTLAISSAAKSDQDQLVDLIALNERVFQAAVPTPQAGTYYFILQPQTAQWRIQGKAMLPSQQPIELAP